jgi:ribose/xylose/arabinose/galactoside ABC-type transport system permease subunit
LGGVLLVATLSNLLNLMNVDNRYQQVIKGLIRSRRGSTQEGVHDR